MKRIKEFMDKPITWGGYLKLCGVSFLAGMAMFGGQIAYVKYQSKKEQDEIILNALKRNRELTKNLNSKNEESE